MRVGLPIDVYFEITLLGLHEALPDQLANMTPIKENNAMVWTFTDTKINTESWVYINTHGSNVMDATK